MSQVREALIDAGREPRPAEIKVWDPFVRLFHWSLVLAFAVAWASADEWDRLHEWAGYAVAGLVALRIVWGIVGTEHARFADFVYRPGTVLAHLRDTLRLRAKRYIGHNPAGGAMVIGLLLAMIVIVTTGIMMTSNVFWDAEWVEDVHETAVNLTLVLIGLHVAGVLVASIEHGENLIRAMITGRKRQ